MCSKFNRTCTCRVIQCVLIYLRYCMHVTIENGWDYCWAKMDLVIRQSTSSISLSIAYCRKTYGTAEKIGFKLIGLNAYMRSCWSKLASSPWLNPNNESTSSSGHPIHLNILFFILERYPNVIWSPSVQLNYKNFSLFNIYFRKLFNAHLKDRWIHFVIYKKRCIILILDEPKYQLC